MLRANIKWDLEKPDAAIEDVTAAIARKPNSARAYGFRASLYAKKKNWVKAKSDADKAAELTAAGTN